MSSPTWHGTTDYPQDPKIGPLGWLRIVFRGLAVILLIAVCLVFLSLLRLIERPVFGVKRPITPYITRFVCRTALQIIGIGFNAKGRPMKHPGAVVANHASWLDIFTLNARQCIYFVSKAEVARWPGVGLMAKAVGTIFISRDRKDATAQKALFEARLGAGHKLLFFPEGTSTDALRVLPFKTTLFEAFFAEGLRDLSYVQPVTVNYIAPKGADPRFYGWWGDMSFGSHVLKVLSTAQQGHVDVIFHDPIRVALSGGRKALAKKAEDMVRGAHHMQTDADN